MRARHNSSGHGRLGCVLWLIALVIFVTIIWKAVPVKIKAAEFAAYVEEQAQFAGRSSAETIRKRVLARALEQGIPLDEKKLQVTKSDRHVRIACEYTIPIEFPFYTYQWHFEHVFDRQIFII
jgi:hypothetical protein